ncbi:hypothetical protein MBANPS3_012322 [Mucor bainieri]
MQSTRTYTINKQLVPWSTPAEFKKHDAEVEKFSREIKPCEREIDVLSRQFCRGHKLSVEYSNEMKQYWCDYFDRKRLPERTKSMLQQVVGDLLKSKLKSVFVGYYDCYLEKDKEMSKDDDKLLHTLDSKDRPKTYSNTLNFLTRHGGYVKMLSAGYYGPHGEYNINKAIMRYMKQDVYDISVFYKQNPTIKYKVFIDFILLPEVITRLIMEDQVVDYEGANEIAIETDALGAILHPDSDGSDQD